MSLALAAARHALPFNTVFYATIATVIPVLFLAIAVQGRLYEDLIKAGVSALEWPRSMKHRRWVLGRLLSSAIAAIVLLSLIAAILVSGIGGEIQAILALDWLRPVGNPSAAAEGVILLTVVAGIGPALLIERHFRPLYRRDWDWLRGLKNRPAAGDTAQADESVAADQNSSAPARLADSAASNPEVTSS
jgi:hypothetical protein